MKPLQVFIGFDDVEPIAYHACVQSILKNASVPVSFTPLYLPQLQSSLKFLVPSHLKGYKPSNGFIFTRFLTPFLSDFTGKSLFVDGDMIVKGDVAELFDLPMDGLGVRVVKHDYTPRESMKYLGATNLSYPRKNWSSVVLFNNGFFPNKTLTPDFVGDATGEYLHRFEWLMDDQIGELPEGWNVLTDEDNQVPYNKAKLLHYTNGTPCFNDYRSARESDDWWSVYFDVIHPLNHRSESKF